MKFFIRFSRLRRYGRWLRRAGSRPGKGHGRHSMPTKTSTRWISDGETMEKLFKEAGYTPDLQFADDDIPNQLAKSRTW